MVETTKVLFLKKEGVYATDAAPTGALNARLTRNFTAKPVAVDRIERNLDRPVRGRSKDAASNARQTFGYELELAGSGAAGTPPAWMEDLELCGMAAPAIAAGASATQRFAAVGAALSSGTAYHWHGTQRRVGLGARGTFSFDFTAGAYPFIGLQMTALLPDTADFGMTDAAPGEVAFDQWRDPLEVSTANTDFTLGGYALVLRSITGEAGATVALRNLVGERAVQRGNHAVTGRILAKAPTLAARNYFRELKTGAEIPAQIVHGVAAGEVIQLDMAHVQVTDIELQEEEDELMLAISYGANVGATPDDLVFTAK